MALPGLQAGDTDVGLWVAAALTPRPAPAAIAVGGRRTRWSGAVAAPVAATVTGSVAAAPGASAVSAPQWSASPFAPLVRAVIGLLLTLGGMNTTNPQPNNPIQQVLYSLAKGLSSAFDPAPPPGSPTVEAADPLSGTVAGSLGFPTGGGLSFTATDPSQGSVEVTADGTFTYTPTAEARQSAGAATTDTFTATAHNGLSTSSVSVTVPVDPGTPIAGSPTINTPNPDTGIVTGAAIFTDTAGRTLTYSTPATSNSGGTVTLNTSTGVFTYTPTDTQRQNATDTTTDTFTVTATNGCVRPPKTISGGGIGCWAAVGGSRRLHCRHRHDRQR
ncbi:Ig-like domain-containing protein [Mycolicibacterium sp.]|uniref:Ig-like domain-containing protein n=1 Tax=Mycolicibacterium sp. TaxID=2320850 RepID=UPI0025F7FC19|nr:Ig-like domain-containing protein [Mycolicibacterium sp.]MCB9409561.1 hypothetical protein [Mycolicibacterium sp.]